MHHSEIKADVRKLIADGTVLPAHPLALDAEPHSSIPGISGR